MFKVLLICAIIGLVAAYPSAALDDVSSGRIIYLKIINGIDNEEISFTVPESEKFHISLKGNGQFRN